MVANMYFKLYRYGLDSKSLLTVTSFDISKEIFSIDMLTAALKSSLKHRRKHILGSFRLYGDQAFVSGIQILWSRGVLAMLGYPRMCHFPGYTFCPKILK